MAAEGAATALRAFFPLARRLLRLLLGYAVFLALAVGTGTVSGEVRSLATLAITHLLFGFVAGNPLALIVAPAWALVAVATGARPGVGAAIGVAVAVLILAGVGVRRLAERAPRWRAWRQRLAEPLPPLRPPIAAAVAIALAVSMWLLDAVTGAAELVLLAGVALLALAQGLPVSARSALPTPVPPTSWHRIAHALTIVVVLVALAAALQTLGEVIDMTTDRSEMPLLDSSSIWALILALYIGAQGLQHFYARRGAPPGAIRS